MADDFTFMTRLLLLAVLSAAVFASAAIAGWHAIVRRTKPRSGRKETK